MREPRMLVQGRYLVWIACMVFDRASIARQMPPVSRRHRAGNQKLSIL